MYVVIDPASQDEYARFESKEDAEEWVSELAGPFLIVPMQDAEREAYLGVRMMILQDEYIYALQNDRPQYAEEIKERLEKTNAMIELSNAKEVSDA